MQFLNGYYVALQSKLPFHVALLQVLQTGKQSAMLLKILCYIYYVHLHTIYSVNDYKSLDFLSKIVTSIISDTMVLLMDENIVCLSRHRSLMCYVLYKCTVRIGCTRSSSLFKEVKQHWARLVRGWMTIPGIFFALIPQYLWTNCIKELGHKRLLTSFNRSPYQIQGLCKS